MKDFLQSHPDYGSDVGIAGTKEVDPKYRIGITNGADASTDLTLFNRLCPLFNIIITRNLSNPEFRRLLIKHKDLIILHYVQTGWGGTPMEPHTPGPQAGFHLLQKLISDGFPVEQIVLRIDPIIPNESGLRVLELILQIYARTNIKRVRYKLLLHSQALLHRQQWHQITLYLGNPYYSQAENKIYYSAAKWYRKSVCDILKQYEYAFTFESCDRNDIQFSEHSTGCISSRDLRVMGIDDMDVLENLEPKKHCRCPVNKTELIKAKGQCALKCAHCPKVTTY